MIPKVIHYCWFGGNPLPDDYAAYVAGWKKILPEYEVKLWNETNFDVNTVPFTAQVAKAKKWGFIVDYIRAFVVYNYGGIYLDTDVEIIKPLNDDMLKNTCFSGFEDDKYVNPGNIFAGEKGSTIAKELLDFYSSYNFIQENGELNLTPSPKIFTNMLFQYGLKQNNTYQELGDITIYPTEYFCPKSFKTGKLSITDNTYSIHHYDGSWLSESEKIFQKKKYKIYTLFGDNLFSKSIVRIMYVMYVPRRIKEIGFKDTVKYYFNKIFQH